MSAAAALLAPFQAAPASPKPLYAQVRDLLLARVRAGEWSAGESLPNEHVLSSEFDVSIGTVRRAVSELETNGVLVRMQGRGTFVSGKGAAILEERFCALRSLDGRRIAADFDLVALARRPAGGVEVGVLTDGAAPEVVEIAQRLSCGPDAIGFETSVLPAGRLPRIETQMRFGQHLYPVLADYGLLVTRVEDTVGVEPAEAGVAAQLGCEPGTPVLAVTRRAFSIDDQVVELRRGFYVPERVRYAV